MVIRKRHQEMDVDQTSSPLPGNHRRHLAVQTDGRNNFGTISQNTHPVAP